jgi:hypothetical protein
MGRQSRRKKQPPAITKPLPKWNPRHLPPPPFHDPARIPGAPVPMLTEHLVEFVNWPGDATSDHTDAVNYISALLAANGENVQDSRKNPIPPLVTADNIGDATGYTDPRRVFTFGYMTAPHAAGKSRSWLSLALPDLRLLGQGQTLGEFIVVRRPHLLGATFRLDCPNAYGTTREGLTGPRGEDRSRVAWAYGGDYCLADDAEGWDTIIAKGTFDKTGVQLSAWRGNGSRVWVGFIYPNPIPNCESVWSGMAGFEGEPFRLFRDQVLTGEMPSRVFVEWLGENFRFPNCLKADAAKCGFTLEKN